MGYKSTSNFYIVTFSLFSFLYSQDMEKVGRRELGRILKCRESADATKVHWDIRLSERC